jgi:hypothetical protein
MFLPFLMSAHGISTSRAAPANPAASQPLHSSSSGRSVSPNKGIVPVDCVGGVGIWLSHPVDGKRTVKKVDQGGPADNNGEARRLATHDVCSDVKKDFCDKGFCTLFFSKSSKEPFLRTEHDATFPHM